MVHRDHRSGFAPCSDEECSSRGGGSPAMILARAVVVVDAPGARVWCLGGEGWRGWGGHPDS